MKKRSNLLRSSKSRTQSSSLSDLITQSEQTMSSQASVYTNTSKNELRSGSQFPQSSTRSNDFDDYEDIIADEVDTLFITPQQQKKIQNILQFARKGKINPGNAFDIPVRVIDPQLSEGANMRFWKFSSELLSASISIYDKRVEYMHQYTNRMFDNLIRVHERPLTEEEMEEKHKKQRSELIQMEIGDVGKVEAIASYEIGAENCEQPEKINIKNLNNQFLPDPLFHKRLQAFDSNTLKSLFMNVFEFGTDSQITFFNRKESAKDARKGEVKMDIEVKEEEKLEEKLQESMEEYEERMPKFVEAELKKLSQMDYNSIIFSEVGNFKKENVRESLQNVRYEVKDFISELRLFQDNEGQNTSYISIQNDSEIGDINIMNTTLQDNQFNFQFNASDNTQLSQDTRIGSQSMPYSYSNTETQSEFYYDDTGESYTEMTPWELQFKGMKLQKRKRRRGEQPIRKRGNKPPQTSEVDIIFDNTIETRKQIFINKARAELTSRGPYQDTNLLPQSLHAYTQAYKKKKMNFMETKGPARPHPQQQSFLNSDGQKATSNQEYPEAENDLDNGFIREEDSTQKTTNFQSNLYHEQHQTQGFVYRSTGIRSLRDIKQKIFRHIVNGKTLRLSELNLNINPNSIMVIFLHLMNENRLDIRQVDGQYDIQISPSDS